MPNWCENDLTISGEPAEVLACLEKIRGEEGKDTLPLDFRKVVPMPETLHIVSGSTTSLAYAAYYGKDVDSGRDAVAYWTGMPWWAEKVQELELGGLPSQEQLRRYAEAEFAKRNPLDDSMGSFRGAKTARGLADIVHHNIEAYGAPTWYEWSHKAWGTKWNARFDDVDEDDLRIQARNGSVTLHFSTAWSPPLPVIQALGEQYPRLAFDLRYYESGVGFEGMLRMEHGEEMDSFESSEYRGHRGG